MGSETTAILVRSSADNGFHEANERLANYAAEDLGTSVEGLLRVAVELIDLETHPARLEELFKALFSTHVRRLYVGKLGSYFKTPAEGHIVIAFLEKAGFEIVQEGRNASAEGRKIRKLVETIAVVERGFRQARLQDARERNAISGGKRGGNPPYGSRAGEAEILTLIKQYRDAGLGHTEIASRLNAEMSKPRSGQKWYPAVIANILGVRRDAKKRLEKRASKPVTSKKRDARTV